MSTVAILKLLQRDIDEIPQAKYLLNMALLQEGKGHWQTMTANAIACLEECYFLNQNMASDRALDFAWVWGFLCILVDILVPPTNLNLGSTRPQQCHMD